MPGKKDVLFSKNIYGEIHQQKVGLTDLKCFKLYHRVD
jgi:hypothetical protein